MKKNKYLEAYLELNIPSRIFVAALSIVAICGFIGTIYFSYQEFIVNSYFD